MKKKNVLTGILLLLLVVFLGGCNNKDTSKNTPGENNQSISTKENKENSTALYLVKIDKPEVGAEKTEDKQDRSASQISELIKSHNKDMRPIDICGGKITEVRVDGKLSPQEALEKLFSYEDNSQHGTYNAFSKSKNIKVDKLVIKNNFAIVTLSGEIKADEMCGGRLMHDQIVKTLSQFDDIAGADVFVGDMEISTYFSRAKSK